MNKLRQIIRAASGRAREKRAETFRRRFHLDETTRVLDIGSENGENINLVLRGTKVKPENLTLILTPTRSLAGTVQIVARVLEVAMHKIHSIGFDLTQVVDGIASAPIPPPSPDFLTGMGRTNDAILFGGQAHIFVNASDDDAAQ